jgi:hypothetical protein
VQVSTTIAAFSLVALLPIQRAPASGRMPGCEIKSSDSLLVQNLCQPDRSVLVVLFTDAAVKSRPRRQRFNCRVNQLLGTPGFQNCLQLNSAEEEEFLGLMWRLRDSDAWTDGNTHMMSGAAHAAASTRLGVAYVLRLLAEALVRREALRADDLAFVATLGNRVELEELREMIANARPHSDDLAALRWFIDRRLGRPAEPPAERLPGGDCMREAATSLSSPPRRIDVSRLCACLTGCTIGPGGL